MAEKTSELERVYTIPLRKAHHGTRSKRANRAVRDVRAFLERHMKTDEVWIAEEVNELLWARGKFTIPSRVRVRASRFDDGVVEVTLPEQEAVGSIRDAISERLEKAADSPVLVAEEETEEEEEEEEEDERPPAGADRPVTEVSGIGPAMSERLKAAGVDSLAALAAASVRQVAEATGKSEEQAAEWKEMAEEILGAAAEEAEEEGEAPAEEAEEEGEAPAEKAEEEAPAEAPAEGASGAGEAPEAAEETPALEGPEETPARDAEETSKPATEEE